MKKISVKVIVFVALFAAMDLVLTRPFRLMGAPFNFGFVSISIAGTLLGPVWAAIAAFLSDFLGTMLFPQGAYFPGYGLTAALRAAILGLFFYKSEYIFIRGDQSIKRKIKAYLFIFAACLCFQITNVTTLPLWDGILANKVNLYPIMLISRLFNASIFLIIQTVTLSVMFRYLKPFFDKQKF